MIDLSRIPSEELLFDRQEAFNDLAACAAAMAVGVTISHGRSVTERIKSNMQQIEVIRSECANRGFDPAIYPGGRR